jgi:hypothetical protein
MAIVKDDDLKATVFHCLDKQFQATFLVYNRKLNELLEIEQI